MSGLPLSPATVEKRASISVLTPGWNSGPGVRAHVLRRLEHAEGARPLGVRLALGNALAVEVGHLLDEVLVMEQDRAVRADGQREVITGHRDPGVGGGAGWLVGHPPLSLSWCAGLV